MGQGFQRDRVDDSGKWSDRIAELRREADTAVGTAELARALGRLGEQLRLSPETVGEAVTVLQRAVTAAQQASSAEQVRSPDQSESAAQLLASNKIRLAIALQYAGRHPEAVKLHRWALADIERHVVPGLADFAWQHLGKCYAEMGDVNEAAACFARALALRRERGDEGLIASTEAALAGLAALVGTDLTQNINSAPSS